MKKLSTILFLFLSLSIYAQPPVGYYSAAEGKNTSALRTSLQAIISNGTYDVGYGGLWTAYRTTDVNSSGNVWDMYSNCTFTLGTKQCGSYSAECDCYNREHTSPQSWFSSASPMVSDIFNVYPTDGKVNGERSNYPYGEVGTATYTSINGSKLGSSSFPDYTGTVFEPLNEYKGDFARTYFYMATRYAGLCENWIAGANVVYSTANLGLTTYAMNLFLKWSRQDPVSAKEIVRNNAAYGVQNNRNPFIDNPGLEEYIWGNKTTQVFSTSNVTTPYLGSPSSGAVVDFGKVGYQTTDTASIYIKGANLTGDLTVVLSGTNASVFSMPLTTISKANAEAGYRLALNFSAQTLGLQTAQLTISGGGITTSSVILNATSVDGFLALSANNITNNSFTANWTSSANATGYKLDVYSFVGDGSAAPTTLLEQDFLTGTGTSGVPTGWVGSGYTDNSLASAVKLSSGSNTGKVTTPLLDLSTSATVLTVKAKQYGTDAGAKLVVLVNADTLVKWTTAVAYQDFTVNIPIKTSTSTISLFAFAGSGHRVYVDYAKVATQGVAQMPVSLAGYPKSVGSVLNYAVTDLQSDSAYYYTVTPEGNSTVMSDQIKVRTLKVNSGVEVNKETLIIWSVTSEGVIVRNLPSGCSVNVLDMMGKQIRSFSNATSELRLTLPQKGMYILQVKQDQHFNSYKIRY
ncbi:MAG: endonuclease [Paludibacter sp.]|nr:endonuclease [Paludibacter sp.]